ncbi:MAG: hypothetical protein ACRDZO_24440 [Egibacteraceae bacterium]
MSESHPGADRVRRRRKRFLTPVQKYEIWVQLLRGGTTIAGAADQAGVDRSTVLKLRQVAKQGALDALAKSRPGVRADGPDPQLVAAQAEIARLSEALEGDGRTADAGGRIWALGLSGRIPRRVDSATKAGLLDLVDRGCQGRLDPPRRLPDLGAARAARVALAHPPHRPTGWPTAPPAATPSMGCWSGSRTRSWRCSTTGARSTAPGRKLAHRGSYLGRVWVSPSSPRPCPGCSRAYAATPETGRVVAA